MELKEIQKQVSETFLQYLENGKIAWDEDYLMLKIGEGVGELMQAYLIYKKRWWQEYLRAAQGWRANQTNGLR